MLLSEAVKTRHVSSDNGSALFARDALSSTWVIANVPQGGYSLGVMLDACIRYQSPTSQTDICFVSAQYLVANSLNTPTEVHIHLVKGGKAFTHLSAQMRQHGKPTIAAQVMFTQFPAVNRAGPLTLLPPKPNARWIPLSAPPSTLKVLAQPSKFRFRDAFTWYEDPVMPRRNQSRQTQRAGGLEWGGVAHVHDEQGWTQPMLGFAADMFINTPELLGYTRPSWFPTMAMTIQFFAKIPTDARYHRSKVFLYCTGFFLNEGTHDNNVEIWTCPSAEHESHPDWQQDMVCLGRSTQMALVLPISVNEGMGKRAKL